VKRRTSRTRVIGPLAPCADGFAAALAAQGYTPLSVRSQLELLAHVSRWLEAKGVGAEGLTTRGVGEFLAVRRAAGYTHLLSRRGLGPLLAHLDGAGVLPALEPDRPASAMEVVLADYERYLLQERGFAASTVQRYVGFARRFLGWCSAGAAGERDLERVGAREISEFVLQDCSRRTVGSAKCAVTRLRCLLRFLYVEGYTSALLVSAVPPAPHSRLASLPRGVAPGQVARLLSSCDRRTAIGRRDFAILTLLSRLGLRCAEVAVLELDDVDWRAGELVVRGKGHREDRLPVPVDVGEALVGWLRRGRPDCACSKVFTRLLAPHRGLSPSGVSSVVTTASRRAGLPSITAHRLRHTAATEMLRAGAALPAVGQVLRHHSLLSTSLYAKVDHRALAQLASPWPGGGS
jgi:integrase/recombinase XerD